jgi:uroporphyrinogen decarboxylase
LAPQNLTHRERIETCLSGNILDRPPVALWRHHPVDDQTPDGLATATIEFQRTYDFDFVKVTPASSYAVKDWGALDEWRGSTEGTREYTHRVVRKPEDWEKLPVLDPRRGTLADMLTCLRQIVSALGETTPIIQTIFNPLSQAKNLAGNDTLLIHLRRYPEAVHAGLKTIAESTRRFVEACLKTGIDGIFFAVQHAQYRMLSAEEYRIFGRPYDLEVLQSAQDAWFNILHLHGDQVMFDLLMDYPVAVINWHDRDTPPSLAEAQARYRGVVCGGLKIWETMVLGTPERVEREAREAIRATAGQRFILSTGCVIPIITPRANILAARQSVEAVH